MAKILDRTTIFSADDRPVAEVAVPEWAGGDPEAAVLVVGMSGRQRHLFEMMYTNWKEKDRQIDDWRAHVVSWCVVDEGRKRLFNDTADVKRLSEQKSALVLDRIVDKVLELSGIRSKDLEDLEKNSATARRDGSPSGSAPSSESGTSTDS